jgi:hypothetical protein
LTGLRTFTALRACASRPRWFRRRRSAPVNRLISSVRQARLLDHDPQTYLAMICSSELAADFKK